MKLRASMRLVSGTLLSLLLVAPAGAAAILFIGNSFTFAFGSPVRYYRPDTVHDLNSDGQGGVPALFKSFSREAGLEFDVSLETWPGVGLDWHLEHKLAAIGQKPWDMVVMHGYSTLNAAKPGDSHLLIETTRQLTEFLRDQNREVIVRLLATWPRADQIYQPRGAWFGKSVEVMTHDVRKGYDLAAAASATRVIPVGDAWLRAMQGGVADRNPYDGIDAGKVNLWAYDGYHASLYGSYLEALVVFGSVTGLDPRILTDKECSAFELGMSSEQVAALEQVAFEQLAAESQVKPAAQRARDGVAARCASP
jgi:hypothetical protein